MSRRLLLFDIDGTLLDTAGAGASALLDAAEAVLEVSREALPPLDLAGSTDSVVVRKLFADAGRPADASQMERFITTYLACLQSRLYAASFTGRLLPGVEQLLAMLPADPRFVVGLLTGNVRAGALLKLERFGIQKPFIDGGFGDDAGLRHEIGAVAVQRLASMTGLTFDPTTTIVIGDTPKDIACAQALGARCLAVATGKFSVQDLEPLGAAMVLPDLADTAAVLRFLAA